MSYYSNRRYNPPADVYAASTLIGLNTGYLRYERTRSAIGQAVTERLHGPQTQKYLVALPIFPGAKGFNHPTILVSAKDERDAAALVRHLRPHDNIGDIKEVNY
jgi:hypothetical protein